MLGFLPDPMRALALALIAQVGGIVFLRFMQLPYMDRNRLSWAWLVLTIAAFLSVHFLVFAIVVAIVFTILRRHAPGTVPAIYIALLPLIPLYSYTIPGAFGVRNLFTRTCPGAAAAGPAGRAQGGNARQTHDKKWH